MTERRITEGIFADGERFKIEDSWRSDGSAHRVLAQPWTGVIVFESEVE